MTSTVVRSLAAILLAIAMSACPTGRLGGGPARGAAPL